ncbi:MAG: hypothetical protein KKH29_04020 [Candidatus Omnitrophica bacterium]|nr:hypothetical protein [Candidatus Omnitrophota bacterium]MBU4472633.1 hypothetical protein [Candidatus Omnitrophota bacterium]MCG2706743.1 hypothetical protein [Candidatus Omnitrophota bacterium]
MARQERGKKGIVLLIVLSIVLVTAILANVVLNLITSQSRLTHHQISRIQSYYAASAGKNYALEMLRIGNAAGGYDVGKDCTESSPCIMSFAAGDFRPASIVDNEVSIIIRPPQDANPLWPCYNPPGNSACVSITATYTYTES